MELNNNLTMIIHSCDKFSDLWDGQIKLLNKNWPNRNFRVIILTDENTNNKKYDNVEIICAGKGTEITQRLEYVIDSINTKYVFVTLDDYYLIKPVDNKKIEYLLDEMEENSYDYIRLFLRPKYRRKDKIKGKIKQYRIDTSRNYSVNLYAGIWTKEFIRKTLFKSTKNAWQYEVTLSRVANKENAKCIISLNKEYEILDVVRKGKFLHKSYRYLKKNNLYNGNRKVNSYWYEFKLNIRTFIGRHCPNFLYKILKKIMKKFGKTYYSDYDGD